MLVVVNYVWPCTSRMYGVSSTSVRSVVYSSSLQQENHWQVSLVFDSFRTGQRSWCHCPLTILEIFHAGISPTFEIANPAWSKSFRSFERRSSEMPLLVFFLHSNYRALLSLSACNQGACCLCPLSHPVGRPALDARKTYQGWKAILLSTW